MTASIKLREIANFLWNQPEQNSRKWLGVTSVEGFLGKDRVPVMENATGTEGKNHINLLTGLKLSLFKDKEVSSV